MDELRALRALARHMGVKTRYTDGLGKRVTVEPETLRRICAALSEGAGETTDYTDAGALQGALLATREAARGGALPPVLVAWNGRLGEGAGHRGAGEGGSAEIVLEDGRMVPLATRDPLPFGYHRLTVERKGSAEHCTIISAPVECWRRPGTHRSWGVGTQLAALRSSRSRSVGDLRDLAMLCRWIHGSGGDLVTALPLLPTFNVPHPEPSPYSPVSRLFWSELMLDLGTAHRPTEAPDRLDVGVADAEVRAALAGHPVPAVVDEELLRYARFRGAQVRMGRNWRDWPPAAREGRPEAEEIDPEEERFHLVAQTMLRGQLLDLRGELEQEEMRLGLDLAVGVHPDGYDPWSRQNLFAGGMSVGAPPDLGFPSGQDWGFSPVLPSASRAEGHRYIAASIAHQAGLAGVLRVDHIMAWARLYWIPHGMRLDQGTYVAYPADELFAILSLESHRNHCEILGENLGTVPPAIDQALPRHRIWGMYLAEFQDSKSEVLPPPTAKDVAMIGTHDTPTFAGWLSGNDITERVRYGLLAPEAEAGVREERAETTTWLATQLESRVEEPRELLARMLEWLGRSESPLVVPWLEDFWLEERAVNLPGTPSFQRPNWQRPMARLLDDIFHDAEVGELLRMLDRARHHA